MEGSVPRVLILGHSFVRRIFDDISKQRITGAFLNFDLGNVCSVYFQGIGGRTVAKIIKYDLDVVRRVRPHIVILEIGTNDLPLLRPQSVGSAIDDLVDILTAQIGVSVVCVCHVIPRSATAKNAIAFAADARLLCRYLEVVLDPLERVFCWRHAAFTNPSKDLYVDDVHLNAKGQAALYRSYRGAILKSLNHLSRNHGHQSSPHDCVTFQ
jgi:lysophospholipase L1-like esterase